MSQIYFDDVIVSCINNADQQRGHVLAFVASRTRYKLQMIQEPPVATSPRYDVVGIVNVASGRVTRGGVQRQLSPSVSSSDGSYLVKELQR